MAHDRPIPIVSPALEGARWIGAASRPDARAQGFSLIELVIVLGVAGIMLAVTVPAFKSFQQSAELKNSGAQIVEQLMVARQKAIATGATQEMRFGKNFQGKCDYYIWTGAGVADPFWKLPSSIDYYWGAGTSTRFRMTSDGRCMDSGLLILQNTRGTRDTISVRTSGLVFLY